MCSCTIQGANNVHVKALREKAQQEGRSVVIVSAQARCWPTTCMMCHHSAGRCHMVAELVSAGYSKHPCWHPC